MASNFTGLAHFYYAHFILSVRCYRRGWASQHRALFDRAAYDPFRDPCHSFDFFFGAGENIPHACVWAQGG